MEEKIVKTKGEREKEKQRRYSGIKNVKSKVEKRKMGTKNEYVIDYLSINKGKNKKN